MSRFIPLVIISISLTIIGIVWLSAPANSPAHSRSKEPSKQVSPTAEKAPLAKEVSTKPTAPQEPVEHPIAVTPQTLYDFGVLPRFTNASHLFEIRNEGKAPLKLEQGPSSCSCTILGLESSTILPGESAEIKLEWTLKFKEGPFSQSATIYTNDPERKEIELVVKGLTETRFGLSEPSLAFSSLSIGETAAQEVLLYSRTLKSLGEITHTMPTAIENLKTTLREATSEELESVGGRSGVMVHVEVPSDLEPGHHVGQIEFTAHPEEYEGPQNNESTASAPSTKLHVDVRVKKPGVKFFSPLIDGWGRIKLGEVRSKTGSELIKINFRVDQGTTDWKVTNISKFPDFVDVKVIPLDQKQGLFQLQIQVPPGSPVGNYYGQSVGQIALESDHPNIPRIPKDRLGLLLEFHVE